MRGGHAIRLDGAPLELVMPSNPVGEVALCGADHPGIRPQLQVAVGDRVKAGETLFVDRRRPEIAFTAPASGMISEIRFGQRRRLEAVMIGVADDDDAIEFATGGAPDEVLLASGLWTSFQARPFGHIPDPGSRPAGILVAALDTRPLAADPMIAIELDREAFRQGIDVLRRLTAGKVILCHAAGRAPPPGAGERTRLIAVRGPHPAGLAGTLLHVLAPAQAQGQVHWCIDHADVIAIGHLFLHRRLPRERIIAVAGPGMANPGLIRVRPGARISDILAGELKEEAGRILSGDALAGRVSQHLGRYHNQITVLARTGVPPAGGIAGRLNRLLPGAASHAIVPRESLQRALPATLPAVPLLRALLAGDAQRARECGCLALVEEDLALARHLCETGADYPRLLRLVLDDLAAGAVQ